MKAIVVTQPGGPEVLELREVPDPEPGFGQVRVRVAASGVNRADLLQRRGSYAPPPGWPTDIPGLEYAGVVDAVGEGVSRFAAGERVMGLVGGGGYAEYVVVDQEQVLPVPDALALEAAAAVPEAFLTAYDALFTLMELHAGSWLLIHAVGSGVGTAGLQLARARELGLDVAIPVGGDQDWAAAVLHETGGRGLDGILDLVGGGYLSGNIRCLARFGRLIVVGLVAGRRGELDLGALLAKRLHIIGTAMRTRTDDEKAEVTALFERDVLPLFAGRKVRPIIDQVFPAAEAAEAHRRVERNANFGKVLLRW